MNYFNAANSIIFSCKFPVISRVIFVIYQESIPKFLDSLIIAISFVGSWKQDRSFYPSTSSLPTNTAAFLALPSRTSITLASGDVYRNGSIQMFIAFPDADRFATPT